MRQQSEQIIKITGKITKKSIKRLNTGMNNVLKIHVACIDF